MRVSLAAFLLFWMAHVFGSDYIWVVKDPEIQDNIPPSRKAEYEANRDRAEAQESLDRIEEEIRRGVDQRP